VTPFSLVEIYHPFEEICSLHLRGKRSRIEKTSYIEPGSVLANRKLWPVAELSLDALWRQIIF